MTTTTPPGTPGTPGTMNLRRRVTWAAWSGWGLDGFTYQMFPLVLAAISTTLAMTKGEAGQVSAAALIASAVGGVIGGRLADRFGRVRVLTFVILGYAVFSGLTATAQNVEQLYLWRILEGLAFGAEWPVGAALMAEFSTAERRGRTLAWVQSAWAVGWAVANLAYVTAFAAFAPDTAWRVMFLVGILPALAALAIRVALRKHVEADEVRLRESGPRPRVFRELLSGRMRRTTILSTLFGAAGLGSTYGIQTWLPSYLTEVRHLDVSGTATYIWMMIAGNWLGYVLGGKVHDRIGRRPAFTLFYAGTAAALFVFMTVPVGRTFASLVMAAVIGFFIAAQATGKGAFFTELFPTRLRGTGSGIAYNVGRGIAAFSPAYIGAASGALGLGTAITVSVTVCTVLTLIFLWCLPETKGIELT